MSEVNLEEAQKYKDEGNEAFKNEDWDKALALYTKAISLAPRDSRELSVFYKNRAAVHLKFERYNEAVEDCNKSLEIVPTDPKALYRRAQALESLERYEEAYRDARQILNDDPNNKAIQPVLERLHKIVQERARKNAQVMTKVESMNQIAFDVEADKEKRETAMNNLLVLARENAGSELMLKTGVMHKIKRLLKVERNKEITVTSTYFFPYIFFFINLLFCFPGIRIIGELCKHTEEKTRTVLKDVGIPWFLEILDTDDEKQVNASQHCMQTILNSFTGMEYKPDTKPDKEKCEKNKQEIDTLLSCLVYAVNNPIISGKARDAIIELIMRNIHYNALCWAEKLVDIGGIERLMQCASELKEYKYESVMNITQSTRTVAAVCLSRIYENMYYDKLRAKFMERVESFIKEKLLNPDIESKVRAVVSITSLLRGPLDVGNSIIGKEGIMEMILVMANTEDELQQKVASECLIAAASKQDKAKTIINQGVNILKKLYQSKNDNIRVRALVGLCKLGSSGGTDASIKPFAEGSNLKLAEACRRFLLRPGKDQDIRKWSAEGLSYLTLDAEVKEKLIEDRPVLQALIELAKTGDQSVLYGVVTTLVNLCNCYEKQEVIPEMVELAKFAKHHIPEEHELDDADFVSKRILVLGKEGVTSALVALSKTESPNSKELISRVFNALCSEMELRGSVVQQGGVKVLIQLALNGTEKGKRQAAQALSRIAITINPEVAFPGQRSLEVIRPLLNQLNMEYTGLENFEALLGLCNIAQMNETARQRIIKEGGISKIDHYMFEDHKFLCRAAVQCIVNLVMSPDVVKLYEGYNDKMKLLVALVLDEDLDTSMAASGALAILTGSSERCCAKFFDSNSWLDSLQYLLSSTNNNLQYRGVSIVRNLIQSRKEVAERIIATNVMEILMAIMKLEGEDKKKIQEVADDALKSAEKWGIIKKPDDFDPFVQQQNDDDD